MATFSCSSDGTDPAMLPELPPADGTLPEPWNLLTMQELILRLNRVLATENLGLGLLLAQEFLALVVKTETFSPGTVPSVYRAALLGTATDVAESSERIRGATVKLREALIATMLCLQWRRSIAESSLSIAPEVWAAVVQVLLDILNDVPQAKGPW